MHKVLSTTIIIVVTCTFLCMIKYYLFFYPRKVTFFTPAEDTELFANSWKDYTTQNNILDTIPQGSVLIVRDAGSHIEDSGFVKVICSNGEQGFMKYSDIDFYLSIVLYTNTISWYLDHHLSWEGFK